MKSLLNLLQSGKLLLALLITLSSWITPEDFYLSNRMRLNSVRAESPPPQQSLTVRSDIQEANSETGVITARGNVYIDYPSRNIQATATQAQYFSKERRLVLSGNVYVLQNGNSMRAETMTYLIDEGRFIATPETEQQVESIYIVEENNNNINNNNIEEDNSNEQ
jgi:lipopolysaccharide export system protein LptA